MILTIAIFSFSTGSTVFATGLSCSIATTCTAPAVVVLRMSATSNSHVELPSQSNYSNLVCCSGVSGLGNSCSGNFGTLLKLASPTNSHAAENTDATFTNNACLSISSGSITVGYQSSNCTGFDTSVVSLVSASNSHVGSPGNYTVQVCATANQTTLTFSTDASSENFPALSPGTLSATTSILTVATNNSTGFNVTIQRQTASATMALSGNPSVMIPDKSPDWIAPAATSTAGNGTASTTQPLTLQFRVRQTGTDAADYASSWWGPDDTSANALFAGISSTSQQIINRNTSAISTTTAYVLYDLNVPASQQNGSYSGTLTYTATANP